MQIAVCISADQSETIIPYGNVQGILDKTESYSEQNAILYSSIDRLFVALTN